VATGRRPARNHAIVRVHFLFLGDASANLKTPTGTRESPRGTGDGARGPGAESYNFKVDAVVRSCQCQCQCHGSASDSFIIVLLIVLAKFSSTGTLGIEYRTSLLGHWF
jgi:hypothetical protein